MRPKNRAAAVLAAFLYVQGLPGLAAKRPALARRFVLVTGDMLGARNEIEALRPEDRPLLLEKPFGMLDVRNILAALAERGPVREP